MERGSAKKTTFKLIRQSGIGVRNIRSLARSLSTGCLRIKTVKRIDNNAVRTVKIGSRCLKPQMSLKNLSDTLLLRCEACRYTTRCTNELQLHVETHADSETDFDVRQRTLNRFQPDATCAMPGCSSTAAAITTSPQQLRCALCDFVTRRPARMTQHAGSHLVTALRCAICSYATSYRYKLKNHMRTHAGAESLGCTRCSYRTFDARCLRVHVGFHAGDNKAYACTLCDYKTNRRFNLDCHVASHATATADVDATRRCTACGFESRREHAMRRHARTHERTAALSRRGLGACLPIGPARPVWCSMPPIGLDAAVPS